MRLFVEVGGDCFRQLMKVFKIFRLLQAKWGSAASAAAPAIVTWSATGGIYYQKVLDADQPGATGHDEQATLGNAGISSIIIILLLCGGNNDGVACIVQ